MLLDEIVLPRVRDPAMEELLRALVGASEGLYQSALAMEVLGLAEEPVIGSSLSQWAANLYLDGLDHFVKRELKLRGYLRYMDDFVLFGDDAGELRAARGRIVEWLWERRRLRLNLKRWEVHGTDEPSTFLGYRVTKGGVAPGKKLMRRLRGKVRAAARKGPEALRRTVEAYRRLVAFG